MTELTDGSEHVSRDAAGRLSYTPAVRSLRPWSTLTIWLIAVTTGIRVAGSTSFMLDLVPVRTSNRFAVEAWVGRATAITLAALWCVWQHAAAVNLARRTPQPRRFSPSQGVWAWFIPFVNLVRPAYVILDLWRGSDALVPSEGPRRPPGSGAIMLIVAWWTSHLLPFATLPLAFFAPVIVVRPWFLPTLVLTVAEAVYATLACVIVHRITRMQDAWLPGDADADPDADPA